MSFFVMSNSTDIIVVASGSVRYHQKLGFKIEGKYGSEKSADCAAQVLEQL